MHKFNIDKEREYQRLKAELDGNSELQAIRKEGFRVSPSIYDLYLEYMIVILDAISKDRITVHDNAAAIKSIDTCTRRIKKIFNESKNASQIDYVTGYVYLRNTMKYYKALYEARFQGELLMKSREENFNMDEEEISLIRANQNKNVEIVSPKITYILKLYISSDGDFKTGISEEDACVHKLYFDFNDLKSDLRHIFTKMEKTLPTNIDMKNESPDTIVSEFIENTKFILNALNKEYVCINDINISRSYGNSTYFVSISEVIISNGKGDINELLMPY